MIGDNLPPYRTPLGNQRCIPSPTNLPIAAPILNTGINIPDGTGIVEATIEKKNCNKRKFVQYFST